MAFKIYFMASTNLLSACSQHLNTPKQPL